MRIRKLDALAELSWYEFQAEGGIVYYVQVESVLSDAAIAAELGGAATAEELQAVENYRAAAGAFDGLPGWAGWTAAEAADYVHGQVLNGMSQAEVDAWVEANVTSLAGARAALKMLAGSLIGVRGTFQFHS